MSTPRLVPAITVQLAWWEDNDPWDGFAPYLDEDTAKGQAADDYEEAAYGDLSAAARPLLTWETGFDRWNLMDKGRDTGVRVGAMPVLRPASAYESAAQEALATLRAEKGQA